MTLRAVILQMQAAAKLPAMGFSMPRGSPLSSSLWLAAAWGELVLPGAQVWLLLVCTIPCESATASLRRVLVRLWPPLEPGCRQVHSN